MYWFYNYVSFYLFFVYVISGRRSARIFKIKRGFKKLYVECSLMKFNFTSSKNDLGKQVKNVGKFTVR